jgi:hypothetical protein
MASLTKFKYGGYTTSDGDARLMNHSITAAMNDRGERWGEWHRLHLEIELQAASPAALHTAMGDFITAFSQNDKTAVLLFPDGTETRHKLDQNSPNNYSGNKVVSVTWVDADAGQLVNARTAHVVIAALFRNADSSIMFYRNDIQIKGSGGARYQRVRHPVLPPSLQLIWQSTPKTIIQTGAIVSLDTWAIGNIPPPLLSAPVEQADDRIISYRYPRYLGRTSVEFGIEWTYVMKIAENQPVPTPGVIDFQTEGSPIPNPFPPFTV